MKITFKNIIASMAIPCMVLAFMTSCCDAKDAIPEEVYVPQVSIVENLPSTIEVEGDGASQTIKIAANSSWTITADQDWVTITPSSYVANTTNVVTKEVTIEVEKNNVLEPRQAVVTLAYADKKVTYTITQEAAKVNYVKWADATYYDSFWKDETWPVVIDYFDILGIYHVENMMVEGSDFYFTMDKETNIVTPCDSLGAPVTTMEVPTYIHPSYGVVSWKVADAEKNNFKYIPEDKIIKLPFTWTVSKGSFGVYECTLQIDKLYN